MKNGNSNPERNKEPDFQSMYLVTFENLLSGHLSKSSAVYASSSVFVG